MENPRMRPTILPTAVNAETSVLLGKYVNLDHAPLAQVQPIVMERLLTHQMILKTVASAV